MSEKCCNRSCTETNLYFQYILVFTNYGFSQIFAQWIFSATLSLMLKTYLHAYHVHQIFSDRQNTTQSSLSYLYILVPWNFQLETNGDRIWQDVVRTPMSSHKPCTLQAVHNTCCSTVGRNILHYPVYCLLHLKNPHGWNITHLCYNNFIGCGTDYEDVREASNVKTPVSAWLLASWHKYESQAVRDMAWHTSGLITEMCVSLLML